MNEISFEQFNELVAKSYLESCGGTLSDFEREFQKSEDYKRKVNADYEEAKRNGILSNKNAIQGKVDAMGYCLMMMA